jgi:hypothetical protein
LSFFDEADEPRTEPRTRRPSGTGRRPPNQQQSIQARRAVAGVAIVIILILIVLGVHSCQVSARNSSLKDYNNNVASIIASSDNTGQQFFNLLSGAGGASNAQNLTNQLNQTRVAADSQLKHAQSIDVPSEVQNAQSNLLLTLTMRRDGIANIAQLIQPALSNTNNQSAINQIAANNARFYASDVLYTDYTATAIAAALHAAGVPVGPNGETIPSGQFLPDLGWLSPAFVATKLGASSSSSTSNGPVAPGTHGHSLDSVSVGGTTLQSGSTNTIPRTPTPSFTVNLTNSGQNNEKNVTIKVAVSGTGVSGQTVVPQTTAGQSTSATVPLNQSPPAGNYTVTVTVNPVPGEKNTANNTQSFPVTFQ